LLEKELIFYGEWSGCIYYVVYCASDGVDKSRRTRNRCLDSEGRWTFHNLDCKVDNFFYCWMVCVGYARSDLVGLYSNQSSVVGLDRERERIGIEPKVAFVSAYKSIDDVTAVVIKKALLVVGPGHE